MQIIPRTRTIIAILSLLSIGALWLFFGHSSPVEEYPNAVAGGDSTAASQKEIRSSVTGNSNENSLGRANEAKRIKRRELASPLKYATSQVKKAYARFLNRVSLGSRESILVDLLAQQAVLVGVREKRIKEVGLQAAHEQYIKDFQHLEAEVERLLTPEEYREYRIAAEMARSNLVVAAFQRITSRNQEPLGEVETAALENLVYREYKAAGVDMFYSPQFTGNKNGINKDAILRARANVKILAEAKTFLNQSQVESLRSFQILQLHGMVGTSTKPRPRSSENIAQGSEP